MRLVLRHCARWKIENSPKGVSDPVGHGRVARRSVPDRQDVLLFKIEKPLQATAVLDETS